MFLFNITNYPICKVSAYFHKKQEIKLINQ